MGAQMPTLRELLNRFRPAAAPGAAGSVAVPADRAAERSAELAPIFQALAATRAEADAIRSAAAARAADRRSEAAAAAVRIVTDAHRDFDAQRAAGYAAARAGVEAATGALIDDGRRSADAVRRHARQRLPRLVPDVVTAALAEVDLTGLADAPPPRRHGRGSRSEVRR
jgi:hypothetical protein